MIEQEQIEAAKQALPKATPGPWKQNENDSDIISTTRNREWFHVADARGWGVLRFEGQKGLDELSANATVMAASPALVRRVMELEAWQKEALPAVKQHREYLDSRICSQSNCEVCRELRENLAALDALIGRAQG